MSADLQKFREQAKQSRQQAEKAFSQIDKEAWLRLANEWQKLADAAEARRR